ncbi:hypothetical protein [Microbulbifer mangrovi]|uniref:hypothetical protein n=1 Tax=Microbulbifer mangrovi TaxID=927787 RepID=UPI00117F25AB|nr:hypothetical protein [Microbulbifer mangrovi]
MAEKFGLDFTRIKKLLNGKSTVVKVCDQVAEGEKLVRAFWAAGWCAEIRCTDKTVLESTAVRSPSTTVRLNATDGSCSVHVPNDWQVFDDLNQRAVLQAGSLDKNEFLVVLPQRVEDFPSAPTVEEYCQAQLSQCAAQLYLASVSSPAKQLQVDGGTGFFGELLAEVDTVPVQYLVACIGGGEKIYTLFLWSEQSVFSERKHEFDQLISSFSFITEADSPKTAKNPEIAADDVPSRVALA